MGGGETVDAYISTYYQVGTRKYSWKIPIKHVIDIALRTILFIITRVARGIGADITSKVQMMYALECLRQTMFSRCEGLIIDLKQHVTK